MLPAAVVVPRALVLAAVPAPAYDPCMSPPSGSTRAGRIAGGVSVLAGVVAVAVLLSLPVPTGRSTPEPLVRDTPTTAPTLPPVDEPWYRTGLPVEGQIVPIGARTTGRVEVVRSGERSVRVTITDFATDLTTADIRVQLTAGDVIDGRRGARWVPNGNPVEVGVVPHGATSAVIEVSIPQILPDPVHSLVVLDWNTTTIMGGAELVPGYGTMDG
jgi:hypothetical protein